MSTALTRFSWRFCQRGSDKAQSLERLLAVIGVKREEMIACGDGYNDLTMVQYAGLGVAMGNGVLPVRKAADYITLTNEEDGVAMLWRNLCFPKSQKFSRSKLP